MKQVIIRADDLGYSRGVNLGIADACNRGLIRSVGIMSNMPLAKDGLDLLEHPENLALGLHTNICVGKPLSSPASISSLVQENGSFKSSKTYRQAVEDFVCLDEVLIEIEAQYQKFVELTGRKPDYIEAHAVQSQTFYQALEIKAREHQCDYIPFVLSQPSPFGTKHIALEMGSMSEGYNPFSFLKEITDRQYSIPAIPVMVCHPGYLDAFILKTSSMTMPRVLEVEMCQSREVKKWLDENHIRPISFNDCK